MKQSPIKESAIDVLTLVPSGNVRVASGQYVGSGFRHHNKECARLTSKGVVFRGELRRTGPITAVSFEDTYGNLISLVQPEIRP